MEKQHWRKGNKNVLEGIHSHQIKRARRVGALAYLFLGLAMAVLEGCGGDRLRSSCCDDVRDEEVRQQWTAMWPGSSKVEECIPF